MAKKAVEKWEVYMIQTESGQLYSGITTNIAKRFRQHEKKIGGAKFFRTSKPKQVLYREKCPNRSVASTRESEIKRMSRQEKFEIVRNGRRAKASH